MDFPIKVGLIGANPDKGWSARTHLPALQALDNFSLEAVCTTRPESAQRAAQLYGASHALTDPLALVELEDVDLVVVSVRTPGHVDYVRMAINAGKHVLCEWPLGRDTSESRLLMELAQARGVRHFVGLQGRAASALAYARHLIEDGYAGSVLSVTMLASVGPWGAVTAAGTAYSADASNGVTVPSIIGGHSLDMLCYCLGEFHSVSGIILNRRETTIDADTRGEITKSSPDQLLMHGLLESGVPVSVHLQGGVLARDEFCLDIRGTAGAIRLTSAAIPEIMPLQISATRQQGGQLEPLVIPANYCNAPASLGEGPAVNVAQLYHQIAADLLGGSSIAPDFAHVLKRKHLLDAIAESSQTGQRQVL